MCSYSCRPFFIGGRLRKRKIGKTSKTIKTPRRVLMDTSQWIEIHNHDNIRTYLWEMANKLSEKYAIELYQMAWIRVSQLFDGNRDIYYMQQGLWYMSHYFNIYVRRSKRRWAQSKEYQRIRRGTIKYFKK